MGGFLFSKDLKLVYLLTMIRFEKGATNDVVVTLTENATATGFIYLFRFMNQQTAVEYYFIASDTSSYKERYNQFSVIEKLNANTLNGEVSLGNEGFYDYEAYQTSLSNTTGLTDAEDAIPYIVKSLEVGLVWVIPSAQDIDKYTPQTNTSIVYQPE